jgi:hypothetical protein
MPDDPVGPVPARQSVVSSSPSKSRPSRLTPVRRTPVEVRSGRVIDAGAPPPARSAGSRPSLQISSPELRTVTPTQLQRPASSPVRSISDGRSDPSAGSYSSRSRSHSSSAARSPRARASRPSPRGARPRSRPRG